MARRKIVLVIVEGPSDDVALGMALNQVFDQDKVYVHIMHEDITTKRGVQAGNIISKLGDVIKDYAKSRHYKASDFKQIIHVVDMDGAYVPNDVIAEDASLMDVLYKEDGIYTRDAQSIIKRNEQKRENLFRLRTQGVICFVPV